ncbi:hypothetical protein [Streptomyces sp. NBC_00005]|uniref:hypothetical protein n=1 Tax=Streptomyces sp. NBC_00005 TaxID=2903609 RepID=UPI0038679645
MPNEQTPRAAARRDVLGTGRIGQPIARCSPHDLEVHPAGSFSRRAHSGGVREALLPGYVVREHDRVLAEVVGEAAQGRSHLVVLAGSSSTGKTRACWEAVQPLAESGGCGIPSIPPGPRRRSPACVRWRRARWCG